MQSQEYYDTQGQHGRYDRESHDVLGTIRVRKQVLRIMLVWKAAV